MNWVSGLRPRSRKRLFELAMLTCIFWKIYSKIYVTSSHPTFRIHNKRGRRYLISLDGYKQPICHMTARLLTIWTSIFTTRIVRFKKYLCSYRYYKVINHNLYNNLFVYLLKPWHSRQIVLHFYMIWPSPFKFSHHWNKVQRRPTLLENFNEWSEKFRIVYCSSPEVVVTSLLQCYMKGFGNFTDTFPSRRAHHEFPMIWNWCQFLLNRFTKAFGKRTLDPNVRTD